MIRKKDNSKKNIPVNSKAIEAEVVFDEAAEIDEQGNPGNPQDSDSIDDSLVIDITPINEDLLPVMTPSRDLVPVDDGTLDPLKMYLREIGKYGLLSIEKERELTKELLETGDIDVAKKLVQANLRLVVKIAMEYRYAYRNVMDLIQEGNIGLMKAVSKYDPSKGAKLSYYSSWWIRSYILKFVLDNFRLVKIGTTKEQKKLFYNLMKEKDRLLKMGINPDIKLISSNLGVSEKAAIEMDGRLSSSGSELSLDYSPPGSDGSFTLSDIIPDSSPSTEETLAESQGLDLLRQNLGSFIKELKDRDREIFEKRLLSEIPPTLQNIADDYGVSRERIRQIEERLLKKLKVYMSDFIR